MATVNVATNRYSVAKFIVAPTIAEGANYTSIADAITAASSGDTIFIKPGTYTEDPILKEGVNLYSFDCDAQTPNVTIVGKCTATFAGTCSISGIRLKTNSAAFLEVSGSSATIVNLQNCYCDCNNATGITFSSSSSSARVFLTSCLGNIATTGISLFAHSSAGRMNIYYMHCDNSGGSITDSTVSAGIIDLVFAYFNFGIATSGTATYNSSDSVLSPAGAGQNKTALTIGGTGGGGSGHDTFSSGSATAVTIAASCTLVMSHSIVSSTNTNAISGAGQINYSCLCFPASSSKISTTTQIGGTINGGLTQNPSAGFLGERIESSTALASVSMSNNTAKTVTSISLTAGIWDISSLCAVSGVLTGTRFQTSISATNNALGSGGIGGDTTDGPTMPNAAANVTHTIAGVRVTLTATTTYYLVALVAFTAGTATTGGTIRATRVG